MSQRDKWVLAFDDEGLRYSVMTTNSSKSLNKVFKGIRAVPVSGIVEYSFRKCNEYFGNRWNIAKMSKDKWGRVGRKHLDVAETIASNQLGEAFGPSRLVYNIRSAGGTNLGSEKYGGRNYRVDLHKVECSCNIPQLFHVPCSHVITIESVGVNLRALPRSDTVASVLWVGLCSRPGPSTDKEG
jgi:hypothetical protein